MTALEQALRSSGCVAPPPSANEGSADLLPAPLTAARAVVDALAELYALHASELRDLGEQLAAHAVEIERKGFRVGLADVEGEVLYVLVRALRPRVVFEIAPDCGWSTNYVLAALTANQLGELHSFELEPTKLGVPTEQAIRQNLLPTLDHGRLAIHVGDATATTAAVPGPVDFVLLDASHEAFFAEWYTARLFPRVHGAVWIHDIAFWDHIEPSGEAYYALDWAARAQVRLASIGLLQRSGLERPALPQVRDQASNAVFFLLDGETLPAGRHTPLLDFEHRRAAADVQPLRQAALESPLALAELAVQLERDGRAELARELLEEAARSPSQTPISLVRIGELALGRSSAAISSIVSSIDSALPRNGGAPLSLSAARIMEGAGELDRSAELALEAQRLAPGSRWTSARSARTLLAAGRRDDALDASRRTLRDEEPSTPIAHRHVWEAGEVLEALGEREEAEHARRLALALVGRLPHSVRRKAWDEMLGLALQRVRAEPASIGFLLRTCGVALRSPEGRLALREQFSRAQRRLGRRRGSG